MKLVSRFLRLCLSICLLLEATSCSSATRLIPTETIVLPSPISGRTPTPLGKETTIRPSVSPTLLPTKLPSVTPTHWNTITPTVSPTPLPTDFPSATASIGSFQVITHCLEISQVLPPGANVSGTLVLAYGGAAEVDNYLLNVENQTKISLEENRHAPVMESVSPDRNYLAYKIFAGDENPTNDSLVVVTANGEKHVQIHWETDWGHIYRWLDNERLLITLNGDQPKSLLLLNPFSGESQIIAPDFPDIYPYPFAEWDGSSAMSPDPTLTRMVYAGINEIILWDVPGSQKITSLWNTPNWLVPRWTVDGERFVVGATMREELSGPRFELNEVTRDGVITQLTQLEATYPKFTLQYYDWSPDERYVAFWLIPNDDRSDEQYLAILNVETRQVINYCIPAIYPASDSKPPIWSPDSRQIIVESKAPNNQILTVLVDIKDNFAIQIEEGMIPVGWLKNP